MVDISFSERSSPDLSDCTDECPQGLAENIRLELSVRRPDPDKMEVANVSTESVAGAGIVLQYFDPVSPQAGFDLSSPFELLTGDSQDNGSVVTLPGDSDE